MILLVFDNYLYVYGGTVTTPETEAKIKFLKNKVSQWIKNEINNIQMALELIDVCSNDTGSDMFGMRIVKTEEEADAFIHGATIGSDGNASVYRQHFTPEEIRLMEKMGQLFAPK